MLFTDVRIQRGTSFVSKALDPLGVMSGRRAAVMSEPSSNNIASETETARSSRLVSTVHPMCFMYFC